ncbi:MAG: phosphomannomutase/phosphoglucomutase, partial [Gemmatimonadales bacterium]
MKIPTSVFREYDIRGLVGSELTPDFAEHLGRAYGSTAVERLGGTVRIAVGCDNRPSSGALAAALRRGIAASGAAVIDVGTVPTPALYFAVHSLGIDGGVQVTGSHNPPEFNGFKFVLAGESLHGSAITDLGERMTAERYQSGRGSESAYRTILDEYRAAIVARHRLDRPVRVVVDCGNGVMSPVAIEALQALGADVIPLFATSDGTFPNHHPDPT